jgi:very-short-patch-repair endonuclease
MRAQVASRGPGKPDLASACGRRQRGHGGSCQRGRVPAPRRPDRLRGRVFRGRDAVSARLLTPDALRGPAWRRLYRGIYADAELQDTHDLRITGARLLLPPGGVFSGRTAAHVFGAVQLVDLAAPVEVTVLPGTSFGPVAGLRIRRRPLPASDVTVIAHRPCTSEVRTALDLARFETMVEGVVALDVLLGQRIVRASELGDAVAELVPGRGTRRARRVIELADGRAESPQESRLRVLLSLAGLVTVPQYTVRDHRGSLVARVDLAFPELRLGIEYDGRWHGEAAQLSRDRRRMNALSAAGWTVFYVTAADLHDPALLVARLRALSARCAKSGPPAAH